MLRYLARLATTAQAVVLLTLPARSQQHKPVKDISPAIQVEVNVVNIRATVRDKHGAWINNLTKDDFILTEDRQPQQIKYFARETDLPLTIGLLVDVSGSQYNLIDIERQAAYQFFSQVLRKGDKAFLISFRGNVELLQDFTGSARLLQEAIERLSWHSAGDLQAGQVVLSTMDRGGTVLYDAIYLAATDRLVHQAGRKVMVLITDGVDFNSQRTLGDAVKAAQQADTVIYSIRYFDIRAYSDDRFRKYSDVMDSALRTVSQQTGGRVLYMDKKHPLPQDFDELQQEMRSQYAIGYIPTNEKHDGSYRHLDLRTRDHNLKVQARRGYYAMPPENGSGGARPAGGASTRPR